MFTPLDPDRVFTFEHRGKIEQFTAMQCVELLTTHPKDILSWKRACFVLKAELNETNARIEELKDIICRQSETIARYEKAILRKLRGNRRCRERRKA